MSDDYSLDIDKFELLDSIGSGQFAVAFKTREKNIGKIYVVKYHEKLLQRK